MLSQATTRPVISIDQKDDTEPSQLTSILVPALLTLTAPA